MVRMTTIKTLSILGNKIKEIRLKKGISQIELASRCEFEKANMSRIEAGKTNITILTLKKISEALGVEIVEFFTDHPH